MPIAKQGKQTPPVPAGVYHAICVGVIDIGTQPQTGNFPARRKVKITWELPHERIQMDRDGKGVDLPRVISKDYTLSTDKKANLRHDLEAWRGRPFTTEEVAAFEVANVIGANCQINVVHKASADGSKIYANVSTIMPLPKGGEKLKPESPTLVFDIPESLPVTFPEGMPEWIKNQIMASEEYQELINPPTHKGPTDDEMANIDSKKADDSLPF
jgi:hypothetical protein